MKFLVTYFLIIFILSIFYTVIDKVHSKNSNSRVPEKVLIYFAFLGGAIPMYITMKIIRHKTLHNKFMIGLPLIILFQMIILILILKAVSNT